MGRVAVRSAVQAALQAAGEAGTIPYLGTVFAARTYIGGEDYDFNAAQQYVSSTNGSSCCIVVNLPSDKRMRRALVGRSAVNDTNIHPITLEVFFANTAGTAIKGQQDYDAIIDGIFVLVRNNPTLSAATTIWSAGEYTAGITHSHQAPYVGPDGTTVFIYGVVEFDAWEWVAGTGV